MHTHHLLFCFSLSLSLSVTILAVTDYKSRLQPEIIIFEYESSFSLCLLISVVEVYRHISQVYEIALLTNFVQ